MEVTVLGNGTDGDVLRPDHVLSVRAGPSRRQGALQLDKKLQFPTRFRDATPFKVDLLRLVGNGEAYIKPGNETYSVSIDVPPSASATASGKSFLDLKVTCKPLICGRKREELKAKASQHLGSMDDNQSQDPKEESAVPARRYFEDHNVMRVTQGLLEALIRDQPAEPKEYIAKFMDELSAASQNRGGEDSERASKSKQRCVAPDTIARCHGNPTWASAYDQQDPTCTGVLDADGFCSAIQTIHPQLSRAQARALGSGVAHGASGISVAAFVAAADAVASGIPFAAELAGIDEESFVGLGPVVDTRIEAARIKVQDAFNAALSDGKLDRVLESNANAELRSLAKNTLTKAACTGKLQGAFAVTKPESFAQADRSLPDLLASSLVETPLPATDGDANTTKPSDQALPAGPSQVESEELPVGQQRTLEYLESYPGTSPVQRREFASRGSSFVEVDSPQESSTNLLLADLQSKAINALVVASENGRLDNELDKILATRDASIYEKARQVFVLACQDGRLDRALDSIPRVPDNQESASQMPIQQEMRSSIAELLRESCQSGKLVEVFNAVDQQDRRSRAAELLRDSCQSGKLAEALDWLSLEQMRLYTAEVLRESCESGKLSGVVQEVNQQDLKCRTAEMLKQACQCGTLQDALRAALDSSPLVDHESSLRAGSSPGEDRTALARILLEGVESGELEQVLVSLSSARAIAGQDTPANATSRDLDDEFATFAMSPTAETTAKFGTFAMSPTIDSAAAATPAKDAFPSCPADIGHSSNVSTRPSTGAHTRPHTPYTPQKPSPDEESSRGVVQELSYNTPHGMEPWPPSSPPPTSPSARLDNLRARAVNDLIQANVTEQVVAASASARPLYLQPAPTPSEIDNALHGETRPSVKTALGDLQADIPSMARDIKGLRSDMQREAVDRAELLATLREMKEKQAMLLAMPASPPSAAKTVPTSPTLAADNSMPLSPRHAALLDKQQTLLDRKQAMASRLAQLKEAQHVIPTPPATERPGGKQRPGSAITFRDQREVNGRLGAENARLNAELSRLLARAAQNPSLGMPA